jgi:hypothetical protein
MACGCSKPGGLVNKVGEEQPNAPAYQLPNETIDCFMARTAGDPVPPEAGSDPDRIATLRIPVDCAMKVDTTFKMTPDSNLLIGYSK